MVSKRFVIRVYGIYINEREEVLLSDEFIYGREVTKFPGGGLEFGEGTRECLEREMMEETGHRFEVLDHLYTTDFFVPSAFDPQIQVMSIYYRMRPLEEFRMETRDRPFDFVTYTENAQVFRWKSIHGLVPSDMTLVIDQKVAGLIKAS
ncbi:MAG: NUDIX hydrolase [Bacteroidota bacterium]|jgi:ADP-ribose pyrophosphatase YjhB (NUDIX family)|uniref:NUDIX hydrolase n=1 Tax=Candidatus Pollutiaquabacter sp. TaxID=3416354 RepID=UPI001A500EB6|nr:NUDIX domain-containing protein [Bacteroidota bacterium]MBL7949832.1 NUDIX domain-containing protein [Bacteroidia bacterium]MBP6009785.1 NUDIX domain-containing protein [Bacteroidia bacterium]MBP7270387.1 NUDIX domain-containing protein [Bacteroidia bacterium]MBP7437040.1 NUDIX domain-containing protein [Bacteroidia bacterium]